MGNFTVFVTFKAVNLAFLQFYGHKIINCYASHNFHGIKQ